MWVMDCSETNAVWYEDEKANKFNQEQTRKKPAKSNG